MSAEFAKKGFLTGRDIGEVIHVDLIILCFLKELVNKT